jgi:hypothetical protein
MPITAFSSFTDGLDPDRRSREHFVTNSAVAILGLLHINGVIEQLNCT